MTEFKLGRLLRVDEAVALTRRATFDPGQFTRRVDYMPGEVETLERWQARAVLVALAAPEPDPRWSSRVVEISEDEHAELERLGLEAGR